MTSCLTLANLDFEYELAGLTPPAGVLEYCHRWRALLRLLPECAGARVGPAGGHRAERLVVWGVTPGTAALAHSWGLGDLFPNPETVRRMNDKRFSHQLEESWGLALPHSRVLASLQELREAVESCPHDWVLKHPFGVSGRERMLGRKGQLSQSIEGWARRRLGSHQLLFEPWVCRERDLSFHFDLTKNGGVEFLGWTELITDRGGVFRGNRVLPTPPNSDLLEGATRAAEAVAGHGYWGALGVDALVGTLGSTAVRRPLVELNARYSFGRLALALAERLPKGWCLSWWHTRERLTAEPLEHPTEPGLYALPRACDGDQTSGSALLVAAEVERLLELESSLLPAAAAGT